LNVEGRDVAQDPEGADGGDQQPDQARVGDGGARAAAGLPHGPGGPHVAQDRQHDEGQHVVAERLAEPAVPDRVQHPQRAAAGAVEPGDVEERAGRVVPGLVRVDRRDVSDDGGGRGGGTGRREQRPAVAESVMSRAYDR
jgi:hypothetical protein